MSASLAESKALGSGRALEMVSR